MSGDAGFVQHVMDLLEPVDGVKSRAMFGGYGIFHYGDMFALISDSVLYFKIDAAITERYEQAGSERFMRMPYFSVPEDVMEDRERLLEWAEVSIDIGHRTAKRKKR